MKRDSDPFQIGFCLTPRLLVRFPAMQSFARASCSVSLDTEGGKLPTEFRIFAAGVNRSTKGDFVYDEAAASAVMAAYEREGVDLCIDLNHGVLDGDARADSSDARGWFKLEQRGGELWATDVKWTSDGQRRLTEKTQRYISPLFKFDDKSARVQQVLNVALVSMPALYDAAALVAANSEPKGEGEKVVSVAARDNACESLLIALATAATGVKQPMDPEKIKAALEAIEAGDAAKALEILKAIVVSAAGGTEEPAGEPAAEPAAALEEGAETPPEEKPEEEKAALAAMNVLQGLTGTSSPGETVAALSTVLKDVAKIKADAAIVELDSRRALVGELVKLGVEIPATAWEGDPAKLNPCKRLADEPIDALRTRVAALKKGGAGRMSPDLAPPVVVEDDEIAALSKDVLKAIKDKGMTPQEFIAAKKKAARRS